MSELITSGIHGVPRATCEKRGRLITKARLSLGGATGSRRRRAVLVVSFQTT